eukprot:IDg18350t1
MLKTARAEMQQHMTKNRIQRAFRHSVPAAADRHYQPGDQVLVWRENVVNNRVGEWLGPFTILEVNTDKNIGFIEDAKTRKAIPFGLAQQSLTILRLILRKVYFAVLIMLQLLPL